MTNMPHVLTLHGYIWDDTFFNKDHVTVTGDIVGDLDRLSNDLDWGPLNAARTEIQANHSATNDYLIAGAGSLGYDVTICGHSHLHADLVMGNGKRFMNTGCWLKGYDHGYVLFPQSKVVYISDLHIGAEECDEAAIRAFLAFAQLQKWRVMGEGDVWDLYARSAEYIKVQSSVTWNAITTSKGFDMILGNHDHDEETVKKLMGWNRDIKTYEVFDTNDVPSWIGFPA